MAVIDYPSGHQRRVCAGHLMSERAVWADSPADAPTIRVTPLATGPADSAVSDAVAGVIGGTPRPRLTVVDGGR